MDIENFEEAFESLESLKDCNESCEVTSQEGTAPVLGSYSEEIRSKLMAPAISGFYLTRLDIKKLASTVDESIAIDERRRMMEQFLRYVDSKESFERLANSLKSAIDSKIEIYEELLGLFPKTSFVFDKLIEKSKNSKALLDTIVAEF